MIKNTMPRKLDLGTIITGYTKMYIPHSSFVDEDVIGKAFWVNGNLNIDNNLGALFTIIHGLDSSTTYDDIQGSYYDALIDAELLTNKLGIDLSGVYVATTKTVPSISKVTVSSQEVDVGVGDPIVTIEVTGDAQTVRVDKKLTTESGDKWVPCFSGSPNAISFTTGQGNYDFRVVGFILLPDGATIDTSPYSVKTNVAVRSVFNPPSAPSNLDFKVARVMDGMERYDLQVAWDWSKGTGSNVREFVLYFVETDEYNKTQWNKAATINSGASRSTVITGFPFNKEYKFKVASVAWGPSEQSLTESSVSSFKVTENTPLDSSFTNDTGIEVTYDHIKAYRKESGTKKQTFLLDAKTGSVSIGALDKDGKAPISVDPTSGNVNVDGSVISKSIYSASFVLSNLSGQDNPAIRTASKTGYGQANQGMWAGYSNTDSKFKFDLGDSNSYIRWDGDTMIISGKVQIGTPTGNVDIGQGIQGNFVANIYIESATQPSKPTGNAYPPVGWSDAPLTSGTNPIWVSAAVIDSKTNNVASNSAWSTPVRFSATAGKDGVASVLIYKVDTSTPTTPSSKSIPPAGWSLEAPTRQTGQTLWVSSATRKGDSSTITGNWSTPTILTGDKGDTGVPGKNGKDGQTLYTWIKYADTATGSGISDSSIGKSYVGIAANKTTPTESNNPADYTWALIRGDQGIPGTNGTDGKTYFTWIKYADDSGGRGFSDNPTGKAYLGIAVNKTTQQESTNWRDYQWSKIQGEKGDTGVPGRNGTDGKTYYTWVKYADNSQGSGMSDDPTGKKWIGIAVNQLSPTESTQPGVYRWSKLEGDQGVKGDPGIDGKTYYTWIRYADSATGAGISNSPTNKPYIGFAYNKDSAIESNNPKDYTWSLIKGQKGDPGRDGIPGAKGADGKTYYTWVRYADTITGGGISNTSAGKKFIGIAVNKETPTESNIPSDYQWSKLEGDQGVPGVPGKDGKTYYTWIKYADTSAGSGLSDSPTGKKYIGFAYNKTTATESTDPRVYTWTRFVGEDGKDGTDGKDGKDGAPGKDGSPGTPGKDGAPGKDGKDGTRGPGFYAQALNGFTSFNTTSATSFFQKVFGTAPVLYDVLTQYDPANPAGGQTRQWNGASWAEAAMLVHGDMIVNGSITADKIIASNAFLQRIGVNVIYDNSAALSNSPEANYTMKIDLEHGSIHIR